MKKILSVFLCAVLIAALLCGCGGSAKTESAPHMDAAKAGGSSASFAADSGVGWAMEEAAEAPMAMEPKTESQSGSSLPANVKLIYRANIDMESTEFDKALDGLNELVERMGGYYENSELNNYSTYRRGYYVVRLPAENFEAFLSAVGELCQVNNLSRSAEDISEHYYDTESSPPSRPNWRACRTSCARRRTWRTSSPWSPPSARRSWPSSSSPARSGSMTPS